MSYTTYCVSSKHFSQTINEFQVELPHPRKPKSKRNIIITRGQCAICGRNKSMILTK